ncbi:MAG: hypothetical protein GX621_16865 [Pirellulaceae bacterium]|nr:hypothetical protein [Pirellulaceae bacterium]
MHRFRFIILLATLILLIFVAPVADLVLPRRYPLLTQVALAVVLMSMLCAAVFAVSHDRRRAWFAVSLALPAVLLQVLDSFIDREGLLAATSVADILFLSYVIVVITRHLFAETKVTSNVIFAAVCVYLLLGVAWADVYSLIDIAENGAFSFPLLDDKTASSAVVQSDGDEAPIRFMRLRGRTAGYPIYFSFVTMTTPGCHGWLAHPC